MTDDEQNDMKTRYIPPSAKGTHPDANREEDNCSGESVNHSGTNWAWATGRSSYDWMDSHYLVADFA